MIERRSRAGLLCFALNLAMCAIGCRPRLVPLPALVVGPMRDGASLVMFERMVQSARAEGYRPVDVEPRYGSFSVEPRAGIPGVSFEIQCYGDGRVQVRVAGVDRTRGAGIAAVSPTLRQEAVQLADALQAGGGGGFH